ncbi:hypothetical protein HDK77DRAFT_428799 [Phyllosticta capitalensis]
MQPSSALHRKRQDDECAHELGKLRYRVDAEQVYLKIGRESQCRRPRRCQWPSQWQRLLGHFIPRRYCSSEFGRLRAIAARPRTARLYVGATGGLKRACSSQQLSARCLRKIVAVVVSPSFLSESSSFAPKLARPLNSLKGTCARLYLPSTTLLFPMVRRATYRAAPGGRKGGEGRRDAWRVDKTRTWSVFAQGIPVLLVAMRSIREHVSRSSACVVVQSARQIDMQATWEAFQGARNPSLASPSTTNVDAALTFQAFTSRRLPPSVLAIH